MLYDKLTQTLRQRKERPSGRSFAFALVVELDDFDPATVCCLCVIALGLVVAIPVTVLELLAPLLVSPLPMVRHAFHPEDERRDQKTEQQKREQELAEDQQEQSHEQ